MTNQRPPRPIHYSESQIATRQLTPRVKPIAQPSQHPKSPPKLLSWFTIAPVVSFLSLVVCATVLSGTLALAYESNTPVRAVVPSIKLATIATQQPKKAPTPQTKPKPVADPAAPCASGSVLNTVAHEDDDILFMNPALQQEIAKGMCVRTVYVTAGDAGQSATYWQRRELGPDAAYAAMAESPNDWQHTTMVIGNHTVSVHTLVSKPQISLVFLNLPDGNVTGQGFASTNYESLQKLRDGEILSIHTMDGSTYTPRQLVRQLAALIALAKPTIINTQAFSSKFVSGDHSDHQAVGYYTSLAEKSYHRPVKLHRYIGYQSGLMPVNLSTEQATSKQAIFDAYEHDDLMICDVTDACFNDVTYDAYLSRQYEQPAQRPVNPKAPARS